MKQALHFEQQRAAIRQRLLMQRLVVEHQLGEAVALPEKFPRSHTMRFVRQHAGLMRGVGRLLRVMMMARLFKS